MTDTTTATAKKKRALKVPKQVEAERPKGAQVKVETPKGCKREALSLDALDSYSREMALKTTISVNDAVLPCRSFTHTDKGTLVIEVCSDSFEIVRS